MSKIIDADSQLREVKRVIDNDLSGDGPKQQVNLRVDGGNLAIALALVSLGAVVVGAIMMPSIVESRAQAAVAPLQAKLAATEAVVYMAERQSKLAEEHMNQMRNDLAAQGLLKTPPH